MAGTWADSRDDIRIASIKNAGAFIHMGFYPTNHMPKPEFIRRRYQKASPDPGLIFQLTN